MFDFTAPVIDIEADDLGAGEGFLGIDPADFAIVGRIFFEQRFES